MTCDLENLFSNSRSRDEYLWQGVSSFLTAHQHLLGYLVPCHGLVDLHEKGGYNQGYLATIKMN